MSKPFLGELQYNMTQSFEAKHIDNYHTANGTNSNIKLYEARLSQSIRSLARNFSFKMTKIISMKYI
jgi:hypothetical protein